MVNNENLESKLCNYSWTLNSGLNSMLFFKNYSGDIDHIVGIAINGVPIFSGVSTLGYDPYGPKLYGSSGTLLGIDPDHCLGDNDYETFYHYYSFSPCIWAS
jgi:hypothetical protein